MKNRPVGRLVATAIGVLAIGGVFAACGGSSNSTSSAAESTSAAAAATGEAAEATSTAAESVPADAVKVPMVLGDPAVGEMTITPANSTISAGDVVFEVKNAGTVVHEMVVLKTDLAVDALPTKADGSFDEEGAGVTALGEVADVAVGATATLPLKLEPGNYVLVCNLPGHFTAGMVTGLTVS